MMRNHLDQKWVANPPAYVICALNRETQESLGNNVSCELRTTYFAYHMSQFSYTFSFHFSCEPSSNVFA